MRTLYRHHCTISIGPSNKIFVRILFAFNGCRVILIEWTFDYFPMCNYMSTTVCVKVTVRLTFFFVMRLNSTIAMSCVSLIVILVL